MACRFLVDYRDQVKHVPLKDRRLAIYRRCAMHVTQNAISLERRLKRARAKARKERWQAAIEFWKELGDYFSCAIRVNCGEPF